MECRRRSPEEQKAFETMKSELQAYLVCCKSGMEQRQLERELVENIGKEINYKGIGIECWADFLYECKDIIEVYVDDRGIQRKKFIFINPYSLPAAASHIGALVRGQDTSTKRKFGKDGSIVAPSRTQVKRVDARELLRGPGSFTPPVTFNPTFNKSQYAKEQRYKRRGGGGGGGGGGRGAFKSSYGGQINGHGYKPTNQRAPSSMNTPRVPAIVKSLMEDDDSADYDDDVMFDCDYSSGGTGYKGSRGRFQDEWVTVPVKKPTTATDSNVLNGVIKKPATELYIIPRNRSESKPNQCNMLPAGAEDSESEDDYIGEGKDNCEDSLENPMAAYRCARINPATTTREPQETNGRHVELEKAVTVNKDTPTPRMLPVLSKWAQWMDGFCPETHSPVGASPRPQTFPVPNDELRIVGVNLNLDFNMIVIRSEKEQERFQEFEAELNQFLNSSESNALKVETVTKGFFVGYWEKENKWIRVEIRSLPDRQNGFVEAFAYDYGVNVIVNTGRGHLRHMVKSWKAVPKTGYLAELGVDAPWALAASKGGVNVSCKGCFWHKDLRIHVLQCKFL